MLKEAALTKKVFEIANRFKNPKSTANKDIRSFSDYINTQQSKLLAHTVRANDNDPLRQCMLEAHTVFYTTEESADLELIGLGKHLRIWRSKTLVLPKLNSDNHPSLLFAKWDHPSVIN